MWLLNVASEALEHFMAEVPPYAILSHTWGDDEVLFEDGIDAAEPQGTSQPVDLLDELLQQNETLQEHMSFVNQSAPMQSYRTVLDMQHRILLDKKQASSLAGLSLSKKAKLEQRSGWNKIKGACRQAKVDGYNYVWIDTLCIDKRSSAELSESINSMFAWYAKSAICYAYLSDVDSFETLSNSRWFTRSWTLQELLAPQSVVFYTKDWRPLGSKTRMADAIARITGISTRVLQSPHEVVMQSIACRMSWAANRQATRQEDIAYSLMGIFDVNMPLLYGEGEKAFQRLQQEIIRNSDDQTILCWDTHDSEETALARHPSSFANMKFMVPFPHAPNNPPYVVTQRGLQIQLRMLATNAISGVHRIFKAAIDCHMKGDFTRQCVIYLKQANAGITASYIRCRYQGRYSGFIDVSQDEVMDSTDLQTVYIPLETRTTKSHAEEMYCEVSLDRPLEKDFEMHYTSPRGVVVKQFLNERRDVPWTYVIRRSPEAYTHDLAMGLVLTNSKEKFGIIIALYFPCRSVGGTTLKSVRTYAKPQDWDFQDWFQTSLRDLSAAHVEEMAQPGVVLEARVDHGPYQQFPTSALRVRLEEKNIFNQRIYHVQIGKSGPPPAPPLPSNSLSKSYRMKVAPGY